MYLLQSLRCALQRSFVLTLTFYLSAGEWEDVESQILKGVKRNVEGMHPVDQLRYFRDKVYISDEEEALLKSDGIQYIAILSLFKLTF